MNLQCGKSELLCRIAGRGAHAVSAQIRDLPESRLPLPGTEKSIHITSLYTHLGVKQTADMHVEREIKHRVAQAAEALKECRGLLMHRSLQLRYKRTLAQALVLSRLFF